MITRYSSAATYLEEHSQSHKEDSELSDTVRAILKRVRQNGDVAITEYTSQFDGIERESIRAGKSDWEQLDSAASEMMSLLERAAANIRAFHARELESEVSWRMDLDGGSVGQKVVPIRRVGVYVPGGSAAYPSSVLMNVIPAQVAGVERIAVATPSDRESGLVSPLVLAAADLFGIQEVYAMGGAQAIGALAYGTASVQQVDKITGPGNRYVNEAKRQVFGQVGIDSLAGPSEILIIADESASPEYLAADLLSQAEHDPDSRAVLISLSDSIIEETYRSLKEQLEELPRKGIALQSLRSNGAMIRVENTRDAVMLANRLAPEHLEIQVENPAVLLGGITTAGAVFLGENTPEAVGDYWAGTNHILPTAGSARFASALSVRDFLRKISVVEYSGDKLGKESRNIIEFARLEGLEAHARSVALRIKTRENRS